MKYQEEKLYALCAVMVVLTMCTVLFVITLIVHS